MLARRWYLLAILTCSYGLGAFGMLGVSPLSPALMHGFALSRLEVAFIVPSVYVGGLLFSLPGGHLADRWGVRPTLLGALAMGGIGLAAAALAPRFVVFLLCLVFAGSGWSIVNPVLGKAIVDLFSLTERGIAMGIKQMGLTLGGIAAALVLPRVAAWLGWRAAIATAFATGVGAYGWVGIFFVISAELGGSRIAGLLSGMAFASIVVGLLVGPATFGLLLVRWDLYAAPWAAFAALSAIAAAATLAIGPAIARERP
jgi:MFS transporter, ACS family, hexuronate transporter